MNQPAASKPAQEWFLAMDGLAVLFDVLHADGFEIIGPTVEQQAIVYDRIDSVDDLPKGWTDRQEPALYRLEARDDDALFGYNVGPHSWKQFMFPPKVTLSEANRTDEGWRFSEANNDPPKFAFLGVRACELAALNIQDRVFIDGLYVDPIYQQRRERAW